ncbi:flagellar assembly protein A [Clostridium cagae]|uniref:flagellar assembly protein A n=1 Tax=Clostridium cagae TaxID=2080751 RepID=UPI003F772581
MSLIFSATTLEGCLEKASNELKAPKECLEYTIIAQKNIFFKKKVKIQISKVNENTDLTADEKLSNIENETHKGIKVENGEIIIENLDYESNETAMIHPCNGIKLLVNGEECISKTAVTALDNIEVKYVTKECSRKIDITTSEDKMEAYITINYFPKYSFELVDKLCCRDLKLEAKKKKGEYPPKYTYDELLTILKENNIVYGLLNDKIKEISENDSVNNELIAQGDKVVEDIPDVVNVFFKSDKKKVLKDENAKIDYRNMYSISNINVGEILAEKVDGIQGKDGKNIFGKEIKRKTTKKINIKIGSGCKLEENKVISTIEGRPSCKSGIYSVNKIYELKDVDIKTGNVDFIGDVEISGSIKSGTQVKAGNSVTVRKNVEEATIIASGQVNISANVLNSKISAGANDIDKKKHLEILKQYDSIIESLISYTQQIKDKNVLGNNQSDGEIIKVLIESKFKNIPRLSMLIVSFEKNNSSTDNYMITFIRKKIMGLGPTKIKKYSELYELKNMITNEIEILEEEIVIPVDVYMDYAQDSTIEASGSVLITGKGQYVSKITALNNIEFTQAGAVCRGGILHAKDEIKLKTVGSIAGVLTRLEVSKKGCITADIAYQNTVFCFGEKQLTLDVASKNVKAYLGKDGMIVIDKFLL